MFCPVGNMAQFIKLWFAVGVRPKYENSIFLTVRFVLSIFMLPTCRKILSVLYIVFENTASYILYPPCRSPYTPPKEWSECPHYSTDTPNECFFNESHTSVWSSYTVQLRSRDQAILYDESLFNVEDIGEFTDFLLRTRAKLTQCPPCLKNCCIRWSIRAFNGKIED